MDSEVQPLLRGEWEQDHPVTAQRDWLRMGAMKVRTVFKHYFKETCSVKTLKKRLPITKWLPKYSFHDLQSDFIAGITVGMTVIPQGLAYAKIARLPPQYGLYSAFMGCFLYMFFGTAKDITLGPTAIMSLMTESFADSPVEKDPTYAIILCFMSGIIQLVLGILHLGILVNFISYPVINGFTSAAAITIAVGQIKGILGLKNIRREFIPQIEDMISNIKETNLWDMTLGLCSLVLVHNMKKLRTIDWKDRPDDPPISILQQVCRKILWIIGTGANAVIVVTAASIAASLLAYNVDKLSLTGKLKAGIPSFQPPKFSLQNGNTTITADQIFSDMGIGLIIVPILGIIEAIAIGKAFARRNDYKIQPNQELYAIGLANIASSFFSAYPVTGSFSRTAVNSQSGVRTPASGVFTGALVLLALQVLTPLFYYIPTAALSAVIIAAVIQMIDYKVLRILWKYKKIDLIPLLLTFVSSFLIGIEYGILVGVGISLLILLYPMARPKTKVSVGGIAVVSLNQGLQFPAIEHVQNKIVEAIYADKTPKSVVLDCSNISHIDYSTIQGILELIPDFDRNDVKLVMAGLKLSVLGELQNADIPEVLYSPSVEQAIAMLQEDISNMPNGGHSVVVGGSEENIKVHDRDIINGENVTVCADSDTFSPAILTLTDSTHL
ncbi:hypothetical protein ScPMuIL_003653 [Solemya velum]